MEQLLFFLNSIYPISENLREHLLQTIKRKDLIKKDHLLELGHTSHTVNFISKGLFRSYYLDKDENETTNWFMKEGDVCFSVYSFYGRAPSYECIQALEDSTVYYITYPELDYLYQAFLEFNYIGRVLTEKYYLQAEQRLFAIRNKRAQERYEYILLHEPELFNRVPIKYIASYLNMTANHLTLIRGKKTHKS